VSHFAWYHPLLVSAGWAVLMVALERRFPADPRQKLFREGFFLDFFWYTLFEGAVMGFLIGMLIVHLDASTGWSRLHLVSDWPVWAQLGFFWVTHDFYIYWFHRLQHKNRYLWRTHEAHHSGKDVDWLSGSRSHSLEILINQTIEYAPITLLGAHPDVAVMKGMLDAAWGMFIHSNIRVRMGVLQYVLNGPELHRWHHAADFERERNFATKIALWDWIFGTAYRPDTSPQKFGLWGDPWFPKGYFAQHLWAFRPMVGKSSRDVPPAPAPRAVGPEVLS
jgi:sterol desaturase/sphingolipid hydroxylase (fatty acid hydroxylase superfamily)